MEFKNRLAQMLPSINRSVAQWNHIYTLEVVGRHRGERPKFVKIMFFWEKEETYQPSVIVRCYRKKNIFLAKEMFAAIACWLLKSYIFVVQFSTKYNF